MRTILAVVFFFISAAGCGGGAKEADQRPPARKIDVEVVPHNGGGVKIDVDGKPVIDIDLKKQT